jgi:hypothetical protein
MTEKNHESEIRYLCYLIIGTFLSRQLTDKEKYDMIKKHAVSIELLAEDKIIRCKL